MRGARREGLSRRHRFRGQDAFRVLLRSPRKFRGTLAVVHLMPGSSAASRFGISIGRKRGSRRAVDRNRVKRRIRELVRRHPLKQSRMDVVVTLTAKFEMAHEDQLIVEVGQLLDAAHAKAQA